MVLQNWIEVTPKLSITGQFKERVKNLTYLDRSIIPVGTKTEELSPQIQKMRHAFASYHDLWRHWRYLQQVGYTKW